MKKYLSTVLLTLASIFVHSLFAQTIFNEDFNSTAIGSVPSNWITNSNTPVRGYNRLGTCSVLDKGLQTPGVGKNAPTGLILPALDYDANNTYIVVNFKIYVYDANLKCENQKLSFPCTPIVEAYVVSTDWSDPVGTPTSSQYYAHLSYEIKNANANNTVIFNNVVLPTGVTKYRILLNFKSASNSCVLGNTKFVFDDFTIFKANCNNSCAPVANSDYFNSDVQGFTTQLNGNVFGGYALWSNQAPTGYITNSLGYAPAVNNGTDYDLNNLNLSQMIFTRVSPLIVEEQFSSCSGPADPGTITFNTNGTFTYRKSNECVKRVSFTYKVRQNIAPFLESATTAKVTIDFSPLSVLPVHFKSFSAYRNTQRREQVLMKWETASEQNNRGFYLQRKVAGQWKNIAFVFSQAENGNSDTNLAYEYKELNNSNTVSQYQIQQVDLDGKTSYSDIKSVPGIEQVSNVQVYPNPAVNGKVSLLFKDANNAKEVIVSDINGRVVKQFRQVTDNNLTIEGLENGFYTIKVTDRSTSTTTVEKVIIKK